MKHTTKQLPKLIFALFISFCICIPALFLLLYYTKPMEDISYNLSLLAEDGQEWEGEKGWTVYTNTNGTTNTLVSDGSGGYTGLDYAGQTFYFSRKMTEMLDSPTLQIGAVNRTISVFLDDSMIYTDCPELENSIGSLELPMLEYDRTEPVTISLPPDYLDRTLTIAQSSPAFLETQSESVTVWPSEVTLYCGYSYESGLIASTASTMIPAALLFAFVLLLFGAFLWSASLGHIIPALPVLALTALFQMCSLLTQADFFYQYFGTPPIDPVWLFFHMSIGMLLLFFSLLTDILRPLFFVLAGVEWVAVLLFTITSLGLFVPYGNSYVFFVELPQITGFFALILTIALTFSLRKTGYIFWNNMAKILCLAFGGYAVTVLLSMFFYPTYSSSVFSRIKGDFSLLLPNFTLKLIWNICLIACMVSLLLELLEMESDQRAELTILSSKYSLAVESYENLRQQAEKTMILRHDMTKHYLLLRTMAEKSPEKIPSYLDELIPKTQEHTPIISCRNQILDILINGKIPFAESKGISTEIVRADAPEKLPLNDSELCCLILNILDNAISAASDPSIQNPYLRLDFHCKPHHFVFSCENASAVQEQQFTNKKSIPEHGYGLKIIHRILAPLGDMVSIEKTETSYQITVIIPLSSTFAGK